MTAFEDTTPFVLALLMTFTALVCVSMWNSFKSVRVEKEISKPKNVGPSRTRELLIRFTKFYNELEAHRNYIYDTQLLPDPKQHIIHALFVGYDESENDDDKKAITIGLEAIVQFQDLVGDEPLKPESHEETENLTFTDLKNQNSLEDETISEEQKKYLEFNNKRMTELNAHFSHLKIEINENVLDDEKNDAFDKSNRVD